MLGGQGVPVQTYLASRETGSADTKYISDVAVEERVPTQGDSSWVIALIVLIVAVAGFGVIIFVRNLSKKAFDRSARRL
jgi:hypothetical protein